MVCGSGLRRTKEKPFTIFHIKYLGSAWEPLNTKLKGRKFDTDEKFGGNGFWICGDPLGRTVWWKWIVDYDCGDPFRMTR